PAFWRRWAWATAPGAWAAARPPCRRTGRLRRRPPPSPERRRRAWGAAQPHLEWPQDRQVAQPSIITTARVLHLPQMLALGGKPSADAAGALADSAFVHDPAAARFSAISLRCSGVSSSPTIMPMFLRWSSMTTPSSAMIDGMYTPPARK